MSNSKLNFNITIIIINWVTSQPWISYICWAHKSNQHVINWLLTHDNLMWVLNPIKISAPSWWHLPINECWGDKNEFMRVIIWISTNHLITFSLFQLFSSFFLPNFDVLALFSHCHLRNHTFSLIVNALLLFSCATENNAIYVWWAKNEQAVS